MSETSTPATRAQRSRWPGLIWAVPIAALAIVAWLGFRSYMAQGPTVTVRFATIGGIKADHTVVKYRGVTVGRVTSTRLSRSLEEIWVTMRFAPYMAGHLGKGTRYWVGGEQVSFAHLSSLKSLIAGPYVGIDPHPGKTVARVIGLNQEPVLKSEPKGITVVLRATERDNISRGAPLLYKGFQVGEIRGETMLTDGSGFDIYAFIPRKYVHLLDVHSRFWSAGTVRVHLFGPRSGIDVPSVQAILTGAISFVTPKAGAAVKDRSMFPLYESASEAENAPSDNAVIYVVRMAGGPRGLAARAPVLLEGARVGVVTAVHMHYDPRSHHLGTRVTVALEPDAIPLAFGHTWDEQNPRPQMNRMLRHLIAQGVRAQLEGEMPFFGPKIIELNRVANAEPAHLMPGSPPRIPFVASGGLSDTLKQVNAILREVHAMPLPEIARDINTLSKKLAQVSNSPKTRKTLEHLDRSMANLDRLLQTGEAQLPAILADLHGTLKASKALLQSEGAVTNAPKSASLPRTLYELSRAAQSLRALTNYLNRHPNALIFGKTP